VTAGFAPGANTREETAPLGRRIPAGHRTHSAPAGSRGRHFMDDAVKSQTVV
jgi:hypothetical protein